MTPIYRTIPALRIRQEYELLGRRAVYLGPLPDRRHEFLIADEPGTRILTDAQLVGYFDAGALRIFPGSAR